MNKLNIKNYAHLGDALWEVFIRERTVFMTGNLPRLHKLTVSFVNAKFQSEMLEKIMPLLTDFEKELAKRGGNIKTSSLRKIDRNLHRLATEFEVLLGYLYLHEKNRYNEILSVIEKDIFKDNYSETSGET